MTAASIWFSRSQEAALLPSFEARIAWWCKNATEIAQNLAFTEQKQCYDAVFANDKQAVAWQPNEAIISKANITALMQEVGVKDYAALYAWSTQQKETFWEKTVEKLGIVFHQKYNKIRGSQDAEQPEWLQGATLNIIESCFLAPTEQTAIITASEQQTELQKITYGELQQHINRVANGLVQLGLQPQDKIVLYLPLTVESVYVYLGIIKAGMVAVLVADSFSSAELSKRIEISGSKLVITCDGYQYGGKTLPILEKVRAANSPQTVVITYSKHIQLNEKEIEFEQFLGNEYFEAVVADRNSMISLLFSSGTTKEPKAIPWTHLTPIKGAADAHFHQDVKAGDVITWTTSIGWMMGPWTIFAVLINRATLALFNGSAALPAFGEFVQNTKMTMLGTIPSLVKVWRKTGAVAPYDWSSLRVFSSTGEASNEEDYLYLMSLNNYQTPIIEYCGGTEIGGGYITGAVVLPAAPATFTTPTLGTAFYLLDENKKVTEKGEVFLVPPIIGLSETLLNRNHHEEYYSHGITIKENELLRKHGDAFEQKTIEWNAQTVPFYHSLGRTDDAMNLGGIKVSAVEIEETLQTHAAIEECAAVSVTLEKGGPEVLLLYAVLKQKDTDLAQLKKELQTILSTQLNPFFKLHELIAVPLLPRTASNKIMRKELRKQWLEQ